MVEGDNTHQPGAPSEMTDPTSIRTVSPGRAQSPSVVLAALRSRAADLRIMATSIRTPLSNTYRRRAAELELQAAALAAGLGFAPRPLCLAVVAA